MQNATVVHDKALPNAPPMSVESRLCHRREKSLEQRLCLLGLKHSTIVAHDSSPRGECKPNWRRRAAER